MTDLYQTLANPVEGFLKEKGSKFYTHAFPVKDEEEISKRLSELQDKYSDARHHCYAWSLGTKGDQFRMNDAGEPSGTAGKPIYGQIQSYGLTNVLIVVVRYFGGTKLGTGGLIQAYKEACRIALDKADIVSRYVEDTLTVTCSYEQISIINRLAERDGIRILEQDFTETVTTQLAVRESMKANVLEQLKNVQIDGVEE